jgi:cardiolipin synthase
LERRLPSGVAWAWLSFLFFLPIISTILYFFLGEYRLGSRRLKRMSEANNTILILTQKLFAKDSDEAHFKEPAKSFAMTVRGLFDAPLLAGNDIELLVDAEAAFAQMIKDIDLAVKSCEMVFYTWSAGGKADLFGEALLRAVKRGVRCRILLDKIGSSEFLSSETAKKYKEHGIDLQEAMPSSFIRSFLSRPDLRIHRKILIVDASIAFVGSLNLADPALFKTAAGVGAWVDAVCKSTGPVVEALNYVFLSDWSVETKSDFVQLEKESIFIDEAKDKKAKIQCLPSGPAIKNSSIEKVLIMAVYSAREKLVLTTPYFIPSEAMLYALMTAAKRGVKVTLITPERLDSKLTQYASRSYMKELVEAGVEVALFQGGMLHTKSVLVDEEFSLFGSVNMDPRSLRINFEISLAIYEEAFSKSLHILQMKYLKQSRILAAKDFVHPNWFSQFKEDFSRLAGPLL